MRLFWKRRAAVALAVALLAAAPGALAGQEVVLPYPEELTVRMQRETWTAESGLSAEVDIPLTCRAAVDATLLASLEELWKAAIAKALPEDRIEVATTYRVSGESWIGFLLVARVSESGRSENNSYFTEETLWLDYRVVAYDMNTGCALTLADVFAPESPAWARIGQAAQDRLHAFYPGEARNEQAIRTLTDVNALRQMSFLPCAGRLVLAFPLGDVVTGKFQLVQLDLYYPGYRGDMTPAAYAQTDNSARPIIALTFDDGPVLRYTRVLLKNLDRYGASATFFCIGSLIRRWPDMPRRAMDHAHAVGSHTMEHKYDYQVDSAYLRNDREEVLALHRALLGTEPLLFRAPGGNYHKYEKYEIGWPLIQWTISAGDTGTNTKAQSARWITTTAKDGYIILLHDSYEKTAKGAELYLPKFVERGFLFATVEELLALHGCTAEPNVIYYDAFGPFDPGL